MRRLIALLVGTGLAAGAWYARPVGATLGALFSGAPLPGLSFEGRVPTSPKALGDWLERERVRDADNEVVLLAPDQALTVTARELGIEIEVSDTLGRAHAVGRRGSTPVRLGVFWQALRHGVDVPFVRGLNRERARRWLVEHEPLVRREPRDARLNWANHQRVESRPGWELDVEGTLTTLAQHLDEEPRVLNLRLLPREPRVRSEDLAPVDVTQVLSAYETGFRGRAGPRARNIRLAARALDGTWLPSGGTLSFNQVVGPRTPQRGYLEAPVIIGDETEPGIGGGVCQVASTVHAAAVLGGLQIISRRSHSRPSGYAPLGLDATVVQGEVDLVIRNPYPAPILLTTRFPDRYRLRVEWLGLKSRAEIRHSAVVRERHPFLRRIAIHPELAPGVFERKQKGIAGFDVVSVVRSSYPDGTHKNIQYFSKYWPVPEVYWVAPDVQPSQLPELPEGAAGVEPAGDSEAPSLESSIGG